MADHMLMHQFSLDNLSAFYTHVEQSFDYLPATYNCRLHAKHLDAIDEIRDTRASIAFLGQKVEVDIRWDFASANIEVLLVELLVPRVSPEKRYMWGELKDAARMVDVDTLAELAGHADDPDFKLRQVTKSNRHDTERRFKLLQSDFNEVIAGLARATERYAGDILRGDTRLFPDAIAFHTQKAHALGFC